MTEDGVAVGPLSSVFRPLTWVIGFVWSRRRAEKKLVFSFLKST